jgi:phage gp29-like protein
MSVWQAIGRAFGIKAQREQSSAAALPKLYAASPAMFSQLGRTAPKDIIRWPEYATSGLTPEKMISITRNADQGVLQDQMALLQEIVGKDGLIQGLLSTRLSALSRKDVKVLPSSADADTVRAEDVAKYAQDILDRLKIAEEQIDGSYRYSGNISSIVEALAISSWYGLEVLWVHWGVRNGESTAKPLYLEPLDERRYAFDVQTQTTHLSTVDSAVYPGTPLTNYDPALYVEIRNTRLSPRLSQCGAGRAVLLPYALRLGAMKDLLTYAEVWSLPGIIGKMSNEVSAAFGPDAVASFQQMIEEFAGDSRQILPPGFDVEILSAVSGGERVFELLDKLTERQIQFALVGQTGTASGDTATYASAAVGMQVQQTLVAGDERMVAEALENLLANAIRLAFGPNVPTPSVTFELETGHEAVVAKADLLSKVTPAITTLLEKGVPVDLEALAKMYDIPLKVPNA